MVGKPPPIRWRAVLFGGAIALAVAALATAGTALGGAPSVVWVAIPAAIAAGAAAAGRLSGGAGAVHGGLVAVLWIVVQAVAGEGPGAPDVLADTAVTLAYDAVQLGIGAAFGWLGERTARTGVGGGGVPA